MANPADIKDPLAAYRAATATFEPATVQAALAEVMAKDATLHLCHPFGDQTGPDAFYAATLGPLHHAMPDLERREMIWMAGTTPEGQDWAASMGSYMGTFTSPFLGIPPTGHLAHMRYHEYFRLEDGRVTQVQMIWDIPELMMQANAWPMAPSLGREWQVPAPATMDGIITTPYDAEQSEASCQHIVTMLDYMKKHPSQGGPEVMEMARFWHPKMSWYGPSGIGTGRGIAGFRHWHQIPFLNAMPDRGQYLDEITYHFFGDANYAAVTGWPDMVQTITHDGWMGIAPAGTKVTMRSLDFWRIENGLIRENWVMVDLLSVYDQIGVDVFARLREFNKARNMGGIPFPIPEA